MAEYFTYDTSKSSLVVAKLIDYEVLDLSQKIFDLEIIADNPSSPPTSANLIVTVQNLDDNSPKILFFNNESAEKPLKLKLSENSPPGKILIEFKIFDADAEPEKKKYDRFNFKLIGEIAGNFQIQQKENSYILATSPSTNLDRENEGHTILMLKVRDQAGNTDTLPIIIEITDDNDNRPMIESSNKHLEIVDNWPIGTLLTKVVANDKDEGHNKMVNFTLSGSASKFLTIDQTEGVIKTNSSLHGLSTFEPYRFQVIAMDNGNPQFTSSAEFDVRIIEASSLQEGEEQGVKFISPAVDFTLEISEDTLPNTRILTAEATYLSESADRTVRYSLEPVSSIDDGWLSINSNNGDIFIQFGLDFEKQRFVTVKIIATSVFDEKQNATRLLRIKVMDVDDNDPIFLYGSKSDGILTFVVDDVDGNNNSKEKQKFGKVHAYDADSEPFNNVYYYLLPNCNPETDHYEIDQITGEIYELKSNEISRKSGQVLCVLTSSIPDLLSETLRQTDYDKTNSSMTRFAIQTISTMMNEELSNQPQIPVENNTIVVFDSSTSNYQIPFDLTLFNTSESLQFLYKLQNLQFFSFKKDKGISKPNINVFVDPNTAAIRIGPEIIEAPEGIYEIDIQSFYLSNGRHAGNIISQIHRVNDDKKLKFVFDYPLEELGMRIEDFKKSLEEILSANSSGVIRPVFSAPEQYKDKNRRRSAVCFHLAKPNELISLNDSIKLTATKMNSNEKLMSLYQQFEVINIDSCKSEIHLSTTAAASTFSTNTILIVSGILIAILLLFSCIAYTCFVTRYREFLKKQNQKLRDSKPPIEPFAIPQFIDHRRI
jgi:hypothetical protein